MKRKYVDSEFANLSIKNYWYKDMCVVTARARYIRYINNNGSHDTTATATSQLQQQQTECKQERKVQTDTPMSRPVPLCSLNNVQLRFLCPTDLDEVRELCQDWFPVDYPYSWYEDITSSTRFYSLAAVYNGVIIGLIVAEIKPYVKLNREDRGILSQPLNPKNTEAGYILSLGVSAAHRRNGIASLLLDNLIAHLTTAEHQHCRAIFLHVLTTNTPAIRFYESRSFKLQSFLPYYYSIKGRCKDGFTYVLYINGGHPPWGPCDYLRHYCKIVYNSQPFTWFRRKVCNLILWSVPTWRRMAHSSVSTLSLSQLQ